MCGTPFTCLADVCVMPTWQAALVLDISPRAVRLAVTRGKLKAAGQDEDGYLFDRADLDDYAATRGPRPVAHSDGEAVPSVASG